jgi:exopolyphosphatase/guanosine-5'-triphosphate,3'-diphosphate pyrophosphatase
MRITRLGQGVDRTNVLAPEAIARTVSVLEEYRRSIDSFGAGRIRMVATSAVRDAENGAAFTEAAKAAVGADPEVLSGTEEGALAYRGASADLDSFDGDTLVVDIGGGSTEITLGRAGSVSSVSLQLGCVRLTERFFKGDPPTVAEVSAARLAITDALIGGEAALPALVNLDRARRLVGLAGTVSTLASLKLGVAEYDLEKLHHATLTLEEIRGMCDMLASLSVRDRRGLVGMVPGREDVLLAGALVLEAVADRYRCDEVIASEKDILDGIVLSIL